MTDTQFPPLNNIRVLDLSRVVAGPLCSMMLADLGAEVIKIEAPQHGNDARQMQPPAAGGESALYLSANRGKKSVALDIRTVAGRRCTHRRRESNCAGGASARDTDRRVAPHGADAAPGQVTDPLFRYAARRSRCTPLAGATYGSGVAGIARL
jgi:hypothetical protein